MSTEAPLPRSGRLAGREAADRSGGRSVVLRFADFLDAVVDVAGRAASWLALAMVLVIAFNVLRRYVFGVSAVAMQELEWHLMAPLVLFGLAYTLRHREHVRIDFLFEHFPQRVRDAIDSLSGVATVVIAVIVVDFSLAYVDQAYRLGEGSPDPGGLPHRFLLKAFIPMGFGLLAVQGVAMAVRHAVYALRGRPDHG